MTNSSAALRRVLAGSTLLAWALVLAPAYGQDGGAAAERARLANQRIHAEAERRAAEEAERERLAEEQARRNAEAAAGSQPRAAPQAAGGPRPQAGNADRAATGELSGMLEQLRALGELRDAGYVTEQEFERIKKRILDASL